MDELARTESPREGAYLLSCTLKIENQIREKLRTVFESTPYKEYESTGQRRGTFEAVIANCILDPITLVSKPSVFDWPEQRLYIAMQVTYVDQRFSPQTAAHWRSDPTIHLTEQRTTETRVTGIVLGIARYGPTRIDEPEARRRLGLPTTTKRLTT